MLIMILVMYSKILGIRFFYVHSKKYNIYYQSYCSTINFRSNTLYLSSILNNMEERIGSVLILINSKEDIDKLNHIISTYADIVIGRQGIRLREQGKSIISLVLEGTTDKLGGLTGQLGRLKGIQVKSVVLKDK